MTRLDGGGGQKKKKKTSSDFRMFISSVMDKGFGAAGANKEPSLDFSDV